MSLIPYIPRHLEVLHAAPDVRAVADRPDVGYILCQLADTGLVSTVVSADGKLILGIMGAVPTVPGVCEVFVIASVDQKKYPLTFTKAVRKELCTLRGKYRRIQAIAKDDEFHARWLSWLGFQREGVLRKFGLSGEDMVMWGLVD